MLLEEIERDTEGQKNYKIFCDLDGVLADFVGGISRLLPEYSDEKFLSDPKHRKEMWSAINKYSSEGGKVWGELDTMQDAQQLWNYIKKYDVEILTATGDPKYGAAQQKHIWVKKNFGNVKVNIVRMSKEKAQYAAPNHILIDDMPKSINPWVEAGGIGILHTSAASTISELKKLGL